MEITVDTSTLQGKVISLLASVSGNSSLKSSSSEAIRVANNGEVIIDGDYPSTAIRYLAGQCTKGCLVGKTVEEQGQVDGWLSVAFDKNGAGSNRAVSMEGLNAHLRLRSYLTGSSFTVADVVIYMALSASCKKADILAAKKDYVDFVRWFDQVQHEVRAMGGKGAATLPAVIEQLCMGPALPLPKGSPLSASQDTATAGPDSTSAPTSSSTGNETTDEKAGTDGTESKAGKKDKEGVAAPAAASAPAGKGKKVEGGAHPAAQPAVAGGGGGGEEGGGKRKKEKKEKQPKAEGAAGAEAAAAAGGGGGDGPDPITMLDLRIGKILKAWTHPDRDKLYCEEIDLGEAAPRTICSGLREFYSEAAMLEGKMVVVVANLKPRAMGSVKSAGMVMCASNSDHTQVVLVDAPDGAKAGDKITFPGKAGEPASAAQVEKKKVLEKCFPLLKTDGQGVPNYDGCPFTVEGAGTCKSSLPNGSVA